MAIATDKQLGTNTSGSALPVLTTALAASASSRIFLFTTFYSDAGGITGMTSAGGLTWVVDQQFKHPDNGWRVAILSADAPSGLAISTALQPTASTVLNGVIAGYSFTGLATGASGYLTGTPAGSGAYDTSWGSSSITTADADALILCAHMGIASATQSGTITSPATELHDVSLAGDGNANIITGYRIVSSTGSYSVSGVNTVSVYMEGDVIVGIKASAGGPPQKIDPDADTDAAGWVSTPLFSKINDASDSSFVTDGLV